MLRDRFRPSQITGCFSERAKSLQAAQQTTNFPQVLPLKEPTATKRFWPPDFKRPIQSKLFALLVPGGGVEPPRGCPRRILSPLRLPVPPSRLSSRFLSFKAYRVGVFVLVSCTALRKPSIA